MKLKQAKQFLRLLYFTIDFMSRRQSDKSHHHDLAKISPQIRLWLKALALIEPSTINIRQTKI
ncbi:CLUMA_CG007380, isoform A [Clunio marinus]|uniref:CLUMA_CG007380, isoform A n=1 Tax=Clunio marinus TaxID=568069 RepID=A0A1J1I0Q5_9DIPT|nr:CLUMA_CG007380, isoform A [Clunio marinus]